jgi:RNA polymerase sigma-70 factor (ECF subfamily)
MGCHSLGVWLNFSPFSGSGPTCFCDVRLAPVARRPLSSPKRPAREARVFLRPPPGDVQGMSKESTQKRPATLGDVLYAKSKPPALEQEWAALVQSIGAGDQLALHALYERAHRLVFTLIMRITANRDTAEELTVDVFHDIWQRASRYDAANGTVLGWIMNQARSRAIDRLRFESRKKRSEPGDMQPLAEVAPNPHDELELRQQGELLRAALAALTPDERQAIETTFFAGLTHAEAAAGLNQPLGTIKTRIRSGLHKLRQRLTAEDGNHEYV